MKDINTMTNNELRELKWDVESTLAMRAWEYEKKILNAIKEAEEAGFSITFTHTETTQMFTRDEIYIDVE